MLPLISALAWAIITIASTYVWARMVTRARRNPDYIESIKAAGQYQRHRIGLFFSFMLMFIAVIFAGLSLSFI